MNKFYLMKDRKPPGSAGRDKLSFTLLKKGLIVCLLICFGLNSTSKAQTTMSCINNSNCEIIVCQLLCQLLNSSDDVCLDNWETESLSYQVCHTDSYEGANLRVSSSLKNDLFFERYDELHKKSSNQSWSDYYVMGANWFPDALNYANCDRTVFLFQFPDAFYV